MIVTIFKGILKGLSIKLSLSLSGGMSNIPPTFTKSIYSFERLSTCEIYTNFVSGLRCTCPHSSMLQIFSNICGGCGIYMVLKLFPMMFALLSREPL